MTQVSSASLLRIAIDAKTPADTRRLADAVVRLTTTDPFLRIALPDPSGRVIIHAGSESQLEQILHRLSHDFGVEAAVGRLEVALKETFTARANGEGRYVRQSGGRGHFAHAKIHIVPLPPGMGYHFENQIVGGAIPHQYIEPMAEGIQEALEHGLAAGYPIDDVRVEVYDGSYHATDSSESAFKIAGALAVQDAARRARCVVTEPIVWIDVEAPDRDVRDVTHDLAARRADIRSREARGEINHIRARVPLRHLLGFDGELRLKTEGRATFRMELDRYEPLPASGDDSTDPDAHVMAPLRPLPTLRAGSIAVPEPE